MKVTGWSTDAASEWTTPYPTNKIGLKLRLLSGDIMSPDLSNVTMRKGRETETPNWFNCIPKIVYRGIGKYRPFLSIGIFKFGVYIGWKIYGVDSQAYLDYPGIEKADVFVGSQAMVGTLRFTPDRTYV